MTAQKTIRMATYNIHKCRGMDRRIDPGRIAAVLQELDADIIALQEVLSIPGRDPEDDQSHFIQKRLGHGYKLCFGENRRLRGGAYGNVVLTRLPLHSWKNYDLSWGRCEPRGTLRVDIALASGVLLHVFNVHLGTAFLERRYQARKLLGAEVLKNEELTGPRVVLGDFNEWTRGLTTRLLALHFESVDLRHHLRRRRTYPGMLPVLHLDHVYFDPELTLESFALHRSRAALLASDHLPMVAQFRLEETPARRRKHVEH